MKSKVKSLVLNRETVRRLSAVELTHVAAGGGTASCPAVCPTPTAGCTTHGGPTSVCTIGC